MESVRKLEETMASWFKNVPHLPSGGQKWLADNIWWLALIGAVLGAISFLSIISATFLGSALLMGYGGVAGVVVAGAAFIAVLISLASLGLLTVLMFMAVTPLKEHKKKGWELLFISEVASFLFAILGVVFGASSGLIGTIIGAAIGFYLLYEIRGHFDNKVKVAVHKKVEEKKAE